MQSCTSTSPLHVPVPRHISQCTFLQMIYTAGNQHTVVDGQLPVDAHADDRPTDATPHDTHCANNNRMTGRQMSCPQQTAPTECCSKHVTSHQHWPGDCPGRPCPVPACSGQPLTCQRRFSSSLWNRNFLSTASVHTVVSPGVCSPMQRFQD
jgi:hypothetical protein